MKGNLKTKKCKVCGKIGGVKDISNHKDWKGYICDKCNNYFSEVKK